MRLFLDLDTRSFIESAQFQRAVSSLALKRRDRLPVDVQFLRSGAVVGLADGATGKLGLKADKDFNGSFAASDLEWEKTGTGDATTYRFDLNLNTVQINALFAGVPTPSSVVLMLEIEWAEGDLRTSSHTLAVTLENDIVRGDEGVAEEGGPVYPLPGAIELLARKGQTGGYAGLDDSGKVPVAQLPQTGPVLHETPNRFTANHAGWQVGDIIRQTGDSTAPFFTVEVTDPVPGGAQEVVEITALPVPEGQTSGFQFFSVLGTTDPLAGPLAEGPLTALEHATLIHSTLVAFGNGTATIAGEVVTFTIATTSSSLSWIEGPYASLNTIVAGADSFSYSFAVDFYDPSDSAFSAFIGVSGPMSPQGFAQEIANAIVSSIPFLDVTVEGPVVTATCNFLGESPTAPLFYNPISTSQLWQAAFTNGNSGVPSGTFLVADLSQLHNAGAYKGIGDTVDFLSGYGAPTLSVGGVGNGYVDLNNGDFYHCSEAGWQFVLNIKGPQGQQGPPGALSRIYNLAPGFSCLRGYASAAEQTLNPTGGSAGHSVGRIYHHRIVGTISGASGVVATIRLKINGTTFATHTMTFASAVTNAPFDLDAFYSGTASAWFTGFSTFHAQLPSGVVTSMKNIDVGSVVSPLSITASVQFSTNSTANGMNASQDYVEY